MTIRTYKGIQDDATAYMVSNNGYSITIQRNYRIDLLPIVEDTAAYFIECYDDSKGTEISFSFSETEMLEFFSSFLAVKDEYNAQ